MLAEITVGHYYPAIVWTAYLLVGLAIGRSDLRSPRLRGIGALAGVGLVILGHGGSWVALHLLGWPAALATAEPHSSTTFEVVGNVGVALLVIVRRASPSPTGGRGSSRRWRPSGRSR